MSYYYKVETITLDLIQTPSINNTPGERELADKIMAYLKGLDYFKNNPGHLFEQKLKGDHLERKNIFALVEGKKKVKSSKTVILHGHVDTVGIDDYGSLQKYAFNPLLLEEKLKTIQLPEDIRDDLDSGEWLFGRGSNDMKSGLASHMAVLEHYADKAEQLAGNVLFIATPVEENQHTGIMEALAVMESLQEEKGLNYKVAINSDYTAPMYKGDNTKYIYLGTAGKLLPSFYVLGKETHAGQSFDGFDPNLLAAELVRKISSNVNLSDGYKDEYTLPPVSLKLEDLKPTYDVQTALATFLYFNYFTHTLSVEKMIETLSSLALEAFNEVIDYLNSEYRHYCEKTGQKYIQLPWKPNIYSYEELYNLAQRIVNEDTLNKNIEEIIRREIEAGRDPRIICRIIVEMVIEALNLKGPALILFLAPPFNPNNTQKEDVKSEKEVIETLQSVLDEASSSSGEEFKIRHYFPFTSDSSYLKIDDSYNSIEKLKTNFPGWSSIYPVPLETAKKLNIPALNIGAYGKDAHKWTERVHKPYTFSVLPELTIKVTDRFLS